MKRKHALIQIDWLLLVPVLFLLMIGLTVLFSINPMFFRNQLFALGISLVAFFIFSQFPYYEFIQFAKPIYVIALCVLGFVLFLGIESKGAVRWVEFFGLSMQFSEFLKPFLALSLASFLSGFTTQSMRRYALVLGLFLPVFYLIYKQPDLGNAIIYFGVLMGTLFVYGIPLLWFALTALPFVLLSPFLWTKLHDYQQQRLMTFLHPMADPQKSSYNLIQAIIAVGSGQITGKGIGEGTQSTLQFLPENHTDFIFASLGEKLGFLGTAIVLLAFVFLLFRIFLVILASTDRFARFFAISTFFFLFLHAFVNIGMNIGMVPVVGVTLPFVSYGGSSLLSNFIMLGILSSVSVASRKKDTLRIR